MRTQLYFSFSFFLSFFFFCKLCRGTFFLLGSRLLVLSVLVVPNMPRESMRGQSDSQQTQKNDGDADDDRGCGGGPII